MRRVHFDVTDSTSTQARLLAAAYPGECLVVTATEQTAGRGRQGRAWQSPRGGAWLSVVWPMRNALSDYGGASLAAGVAVLKAVAAVAPECADRLQVKWPNDVLVDGRKLAGILCERFVRASGADALIVGVGVNVDVDMAQLAADVRDRATTLRTAIQQPVATDDVATAVAEELFRALLDLEHNGLTETVLAELRAHLAYVGSVQRVESSGGLVSGRVVGIDSLGRLLLRTDDGEVAIDSGELLADAPA